MLNNLKLISESAQLRPFLERGFGIELLFLLQEVTYKDKDWGIEDVFDQIKAPKPRIAAFRDYLTFLETKKCIYLTVSEEKRSKRCLRLSQTTMEALEALEGQENRPR